MCDLLEPSTSRISSASNKNAPASAVNNRQRRLKSLIDVNPCPTAGRKVPRLSELIASSLGSVPRARGRPTGLYAPTQAADVSHVSTNSMRHQGPTRAKWPPYYVGVGESSSKKSYKARKLDDRSLKLA